MIKYFVSYVSLKGANSLAFGNATLEMPPIVHENAIEALQKKLKENMSSVSDVIILYWRRYDEP